MRYINLHNIYIRCSILALTLLITQASFCQVMDTGHKIDTLSAADRLAFRTNAVEWLILVPNIGIEYDLGRYNYNRYSIGLNLRYNWQTSHTFKTGVIFNVAEARLELRNYYRIREFSNYVERKKGFVDRLLSPRREVSKHPTTTFYRGVFAAYNKFTMKLGKEGHQGNAIIGGVMWGMIKPLYAFRNGNSLDLEFAAAVGLAYAKYDTFEHDPFFDYYPKTGHKTTFMPVINDLRVGFVYRLGNYPITKKYRWRYDVDMAYQTAHDNKLLEERRETESKAFNDSLDNYVRDLFWHKYDSLAKENRFINDSLRFIGQDEKSLKKAAKKDEKEARKAAEEAEKEARKAEKESQKASKKNARKDEETSAPEGSPGRTPSEPRPDSEEPGQPAAATDEKGGES